VTLAGHAHLHAPAPLHDVPSRDCPKCGPVTGWNLTDKCCLCSLPYLPHPSDRYSAEAIEQQRQNDRNQRL
jgi:hypothetical protein